MRKLLLAIVPAIAMTALPALAQSSVSSESTTTTTGTVQAPVASETMSKKTYKSETTAPDGTTTDTNAMKKTTTNAFGDTSQVSKEHHATVTNGVDGSHSESSTTTTQTSPN